MKEKRIETEEWNPLLLPLKDGLASVVVGKEKVLKLLLTALLASGHCLIEDVPGVGKTMLVKSLAKLLGCDFKRIQFTPDLLPSDVTGVSIYNQRTQTFEFRMGPIFGQLVLADEINRTSPKTQSALLEALEEEAVTVDGETYTLPSPFLLLATENPIEFEGTFPLPEAQLDRFMMKIHMGYPSPEEELVILQKHGAGSPLKNLSPVASPTDVLNWRNEATAVHMEKELQQYIVTLVQNTRRLDKLLLGASPRAAIALQKAAKALAFVSGRTYVVPDDIRYLAPYVLSHRLILAPEARLNGETTEVLIEEVLARVAIPFLQGARV
ncbi:AAA family ATPase [Alicyclobacillus tolerans]|uniref:MoxR-like ATPase n=2 Tax=Alicyclobacillus tolerans TaxID=90970 RepID=A0ABT9LZF9_9BACL|nr:MULTISPECIES: MoxR family ATPase [Alicyclobacillus]MDP9729635.1 MoxR-like ATPase [Alicyclobacillus tengchongensis]SHK25790.1 MoxR-like ATPase [Alicyclobacillus montanus]